MTDSEREAAMTDLSISLDRMRRAGAVRAHFHAGAMAALEAVLTGGTADQQADFITAAQTTYVEGLA